MEQWINKDCQEVRFRGEFMAGVAFGNMSEIVTNLGSHPFTFQQAAPTSGKI